MKRSPLRILAAVIILAIGVVIIVFITQQAEYRESRLYQLLGEWLYGACAAIGLVEVLFFVPVKSGFYLWTAPAWVGWFVYANRPVQSHRDVPALAGGA